VLDKAEYSAFESALNSPIVSYRIVTKLSELTVTQVDNNEDKERFVQLTIVLPLACKVRKETA